MLRHCISIVAMLICSVAAAQDSWILTGADFRTERVQFVSIDPQGILVRAPGETEDRRIEFSRFLQLRRSDRAVAAGGGAGFIAILKGADRVAGQPKQLQGDNLIWNHPTLGEISLPLRSIVSLTRADASGSPQATAQTEDVVLLSNGDTVRGIISTISGSAVALQLAGGDVIDVPLDSVRRMSFASTGDSRDAGKHGFRVGLVDGSALTASSVRSAQGALELQLPDESMRSIPMAEVVSIEHVNGPVVWLSTVAPIQSRHTPFLDMSWPVKMDRAVDGEPIRFGQRSYERGIGVHSFSQLTWAIDPAYKAFRTQYAIAGDFPYANVTVRIKVDDQVVHEQEDFRAGVLSPPIVIPLDNASKLTLEVDYGQNYDVQDRLNWIEPALLRDRPATREAR